MDETISRALRRIGHPNIVLKTEQRASIESIFEGKDVFLWLPTGFGKSVCYEMLPFVLRSSEDSLVVVVSPLISLMIDQVQSLRRRSVKSAIMSSGSKVDKEYLATSEDIKTSNILFCAPEAIDTEKWRDVIADPNVSSRIVAIIVDEAHCLSKWSHDFRPSYGRLNEIRALVPKGTPLLACSATITHGIRQEVIQTLEMTNYEFICTSPDRPNIFYEVRPRTIIDDDMKDVVESLKRFKNCAPRVIVYCRTLDMCANLYAHFHYELGDSSYYPPGSEKISDNRLFGMYHANTPKHNKEVILNSLTRPDGNVRLVFATVAMGMGINLRDVNTILHYGAPQSIEDYFQESGRGGRSGQAARSTIYWKPSDCPLRKNLVNTRDHEVAAVRYYLENNTSCRRKWLLEYFDPSFSKKVQHVAACCDICEKCKQSTELKL